SGRRIVVIAEEKDVVDGGTDFPRGGINETETHIAAGEFHSIEIAGNVAAGSEQQNSAGVGEVVVLGVEAIAEIGGRGNGFNGFARASEEMPSGSGFRAAEVFERRVLLAGSFFGSVAVVKADEKDLIVTPGIEGKHAQGADHALLNLIA